MRKILYLIALSFFLFGCVQEEAPIYKNEIYLTCDSNGWDEKDGRFKYLAVRDVLFGDPKKKNPTYITGLYEYTDKEYLLRRNNLLNSLSYSSDKFLVFNLAAYKGYSFAINRISLIAAFNDKFYEKSKEFRDDYFIEEIINKSYHKLECRLSEKAKAKI